MIVPSSSNPGLFIDYRHPKDLRPAKNNARTHSADQINKIANSIRAFGFNNPVLLDNRGDIVAGHGRVLAAVEIGLTEVPTVVLSHLSAAQKRAYVIADNRLAELSGWDKELLSAELTELLSIEIDFDIGDIGFDTPELDLMLAKPKGDVQDPADDLSKLTDVPPVASRGDLWALGEHLLFCGDALDEESYRVLLGDERAQMVFTDPPYNVPINGHVSGLGKARHREFAMASGEMSSSEFTQFLKQACSRATAFSANGAIHYVCMDWRGTVRRTGLLVAGAHEPQIKSTAT